MTEAGPTAEVGELLDVLADDSCSGDGGEKFRAEVAEIDAKKEAAEAARSQASIPLKPEKLLSRGTHVEIQNLQSRADLNGKAARVVGYVEEKGRYKVRIDEDGTSLAVKPDCLVVKAVQTAAKHKDSPTDTGGPVNIPQNMLEDFEDQQKKLTTAAIQLETLEERLQAMLRDARRVELTKKEVALVDEGTTMFAQYGRCFVQQNKSALEESLEEQTKKYQAQIKKTRDSAQYYARQKDETSANLNEMLDTLRKMQNS